ncbi:DUF6062 family protein [Marispirochaeta sp.]|uniref:DUF6062 family protein n=1 Tax=Marispirochaeta sp. TaxID=2038653 RepID=UPI0029C6B8E8|nr:DUF6062 family protein [Marispirochaeta sp.]
MKYKLETIPVWDAFDADSECPFCLLEQKAEKGYLKYYLGSSVMAPETRVTVNARGFCREHFLQLRGVGGERHALSLLTHTRFEETALRTEKALEKLKGYNKKRINAVLDELKVQDSGCVICDRLEETLKRYYFTVVYLWQTDDQGFRKRYLESRGVCLRHVRGLLAMAAETLRPGFGKDQWKEWIEATLTIQRNSSRRLRTELFDYSRSFDPQYERNDLHYGDDTLDRGIQKLKGRFITP